MSKLVSFICPTFQHAQYIPTAIRGVLCQSYRNIELIVVSVCGDVETEVALAPFQPKIHHIIHGRADHIAQINVGIKNAKGMFISILGSDDFALPNKIESEMKVATATDAVLVYSRFFYADEHLNIQAVPSLPNFSYQYLVKRNFITDCSLVKKEMYEEFGLFDESLGSLAVYDKWLHIAEKYEDYITFNPVPTFIYRTHTRQKHKSRMSNPQHVKLYEKIVKASLKRKGLPTKDVKFHVHKIDTPAV